MMPIGPAPVIKTSSPKTSNWSAVWTALPNGSKIDCTSRGMLGSCAQTLVIGSDRYSANAPGRLTPTPLVSLHRCLRPARQLRHRPQTTCPSPLTISPTRKSLTFEPTSTISPTNSCPTTIGTGIVFCAQASHTSICTSVPQIPVRNTLISTSLIPIRGNGTSSSQRPGLASFFTRASIVSIAVFSRMPFERNRPRMRRNRFSVSLLSQLKANFVGEASQCPMERRLRYDFLMGSLSRSDNLGRMRDRAVWDIVVIGGGATGLGAAVDAASRGYGTLLLESNDFSQGTSSRSTKLIHGGVRYLEQGNIPLVREALRERGILLKNAPHLVHPLDFLVPAYRWHELPYYGIGLKVYDLLAGRLRLGWSRWVSRAEVKRRIPTIHGAGLRGGIIYTDGQFDDARLAITLARTLVDLGGTALNKVPVTGLTEHNARISGVTARDDESGEEFA